MHQKPPALRCLTPATRRSVVTKHTTAYSHALKTNTLPPFTTTVHTRVNHPKIPPHGRHRHRPHLHLRHLALLQTREAERGRGRGSASRREAEGETEAEGAGARAGKRRRERENESKSGGRRHNEEDTEKTRRVTYVRDTQPDKDAVAEARLVVRETAREM